jgi:lambda family phage portal protein
MGTPGGVGTNFEESLLRHTAAALGLSYEQFSRDYSKTSYSSARASMGETWKYMQSRKKVVADRFASMIYQLWLEEEINARNVPLPRGITLAKYYADPIIREAIASSEWIGASRGQIDEKKETESAILRIENGLSTREKENARLGEDWRKIYRQRSREIKLEEKLGLKFGEVAKAAAAQNQNEQPDDENQDQTDPADARN